MGEMDEENEEELNPSVDIYEVNNRHTSDFHIQHTNYESSTEHQTKQCDSKAHYTNNDDTRQKHTKMHPTLFKSKQGLYIVPQVYHTQPYNVHLKCLHFSKLNQN